MMYCELCYMTAKTLSGPHSFFLRMYQMLLICSLVVVAVSLIYYYSFFFSLMMPSLTGTDIYMCLMLKLTVKSY